MFFFSSVVAVVILFLFLLLRLRLLLLLLLLNSTELKRLCFGRLCKLNQR
jgi:hypothetical protein